MTDDMHTRLSHAEWEIKALKEIQERQGDRLVSLSERIDVQHQEVMAAIGSLRDDRARELGAKEARQTAIKWASLIVGIIGTMAAVGMLNTAEGAILPMEMMVDAPIPVQYCSRELP